MNEKSEVVSLNRVGFYTALSTMVITIISFVLAMIAIPISGANCPENCITYPYLDSVAQYPRDFMWMIPAMVLMVVYVALMAVIHAYASPQKKVFSQISLSVALLSAAVLLIAYYIQFSVVPMSLMNDETEGLALIIQYNPHGIFIALEELGYILMTLSFLFVAPVFTGENRLSQAVRWIFIGSFIINLLAIIGIGAAFGLERLDRLEVIILSVDWLVLIINGGLLSQLFRQADKTLS